MYHYSLKIQNAQFSPIHSTNLAQTKGYPLCAKVVITVASGIGYSAATGSGTQAEPAQLPGISALVLCKHHHLSTASGSRRVHKPSGHRDNDFGAQWAPLALYMQVGI